MTILCSTCFSFKGLNETERNKENSLNGYCCCCSGGYLVIFLVFSKGYTQNVIIPMIAYGEKNEHMTRKRGRIISILRCFHTHSDSNTHTLWMCCTTNVLYEVKYIEWNN